MSYPFAGFASLLFRNDERPLAGTDTLWRRTPTRDQSGNLGSARDSIVTLAARSALRSFEIHLDPDRFDAWEALINRVDTFTDWRRPTPDSRPALLAEVFPVREVGVICADSVTRRKIVARFTFIEQAA